VFTADLLKAINDKIDIYIHSRLKQKTSVHPISFVISAHASIHLVRKRLQREQSRHIPYSIV